MSCHYPIVKNVEDYENLQELFDFCNRNNLPQPVMYSGGSLVENLLFDFVAEEFRCMEVQHET